MNPKFSFGVNQGVYPCCNAQALRFSTSIKKQGCTSKNHVLKSSASPRKQNAEKQKAFEMLQKHFSEVCEPYEFEKENASTG